MLISISIDTLLKKYESIVRAATIGNVFDEEHKMKENRCGFSMEVRKTETGLDGLVVSVYYK